MDKYPNVNVWVGDYGAYEIPDEIYSKVRLTIDRWPDARFLSSKPFMEWVKQQEKAAKAEILA